MSQLTFIVKAFDTTLWCSILECRFTIEKIESLRCILGGECHDDPELDHSYHIEKADIDELNKSFGVGFDSSIADGPAIEVHLEKECLLPIAPYLIHTNFELPLMLQGQKKLARFADLLPEAEQAFDRWVEKDLLHKEVILKPIPESFKPYRIDPNHKFDRWIYYCLKGEEWRIPAMELLWDTGTTAGWTEEHERLEGKLYGYEDWQSSWWINYIKSKRGGIGGIALCCTVDEDGLAWLEEAGYRALPPIECDFLEVRLWDSDNAPAMMAFLLENANATALVRFNVRYAAQKKFFPMSRDQAGPFMLTRTQVSNVNRNLKNSIDLVLRRSECETQ